MEKIGSASVYIGDCLESLRSMPDRSVHCCVTSPPYWGLRDYRVDGQLGLEKTPEEYVAKMVEVFREVRRVLRDDGTLWLNLGLSYASGDTRPTRSPLLERVPACGICGKESQDSQAAGRACLGSCDGLQGETRSRRAGIARNDQSETQDEQQTSRKVRDTEPEGFDQEQLSASPHVVQLSTIPKSSFQRQDVSCLSGEALASQQLPPPSSACVHQSEHRSACTCGTSQTLPPLAVHTEGKESFFSACRAPGCRGIGRCGLCWCSLSIPALNIKQKDEVNTPHLIAMALQADGWVLRQTVIWSKSNPMPESVTDRCTKSHEYVFLLTKSARYFYDADAVKELSVDPESHRGRNRRNDDKFVGQPMSETRGGFSKIEAGKTYQTKNRRSVWHISTRSYKGAHFATFPTTLVEPCVKAGTSEYGACAECGSPWSRIVSKVRRATRPGADTKISQSEGGLGGEDRSLVIGNRDPQRHVTETKTEGWVKTCKCETNETRPCVVLDPFGGSGTTGRVASDLGRASILCELNADYVELIRKRLTEPSRPVKKKRQSSVSPLPVNP